MNVWGVAAWWQIYNYNMQLRIRPLCRERTYKNGFPNSKIGKYTPLVCFRSSKLPLCHSTTNDIPSLHKGHTSCLREPPLIPMQTDRSPSRHNKATAKLQLHTNCALHAKNCSIEGSARSHLSNWNDDNSTYPNEISYILHIPMRVYPIIGPPLLPHPFFSTAKYLRQRSKAYGQTSQLDTSALIKTTKISAHGAYNALLRTCKIK